VVIFTHVPTIMMISSYTLLIYYWIKKFSGGLKNSNDTTNDKYTRFYLLLIFHIVIYLGECGFIGCLIFIFSYEDIILLVQSFYISVFLILTTMFYICYGFYIFVVGKHLLFSRSLLKRKKLKKVTTTSIIVTICFILRFAMNILMTLVPIFRDQETDFYYVVIFIYYIVFEVFPLVLLLLLLTALQKISPTQKRLTPLLAPPSITSLYNDETLPYSGKLVL